MRRSPGYNYQPLSQSEVGASTSNASAVGGHDILEEENERMAEELKDTINSDPAENTTNKTAINLLEQYVLLAKSTKGAACLELIRQVLEAPGVHVFGELLDMPNIQELEKTHVNFWNTLQLFAYGTYKQYLENKQELVELTPIMQRKLRHLTIVSLAIRSKCIPYKLLLEELQISNVRDLEDLIIESIYADIIHGKLDQQNSQLEVDYAIGRDIRTNDISNISATLQEWCDSCETVMGCIENQVDRANIEKCVMLKKKLDVETEISNLKKTIKTQLLDDDVMLVDSREAISLSGDLRKKSNKHKSIRSTGKSWFKGFNLDKNE